MTTATPPKLAQDALGASAPAPATSGASYLSAKRGTLMLAGLRSAKNADPFHFFKVATLNPDPKGNP